MPVFKIKMSSSINVNSYKGKQIKNDNKTYTTQMNSNVCYVFIICVYDLRIIKFQSKLSFLFFNQTNC